VDRGISWAEAVAARDAAKEAAPGGAKANGRGDGFDTMDRKGTRHVLLAVERQPALGEDPEAALRKKNRQIRVFRPSTGEHANQADYILSRYARVTDAAARKMWAAIFAATAESCMHGAKCKIGATCEAGKRVRSVHLLAGSTLPLWGTVELVLRQKTRARTFSIIRVVQTEGLVEAPAASGGARRSRKPAAARAPAKKKADRTAGATGSEAAKMPRKVIGISLPAAHAQEVLDAIARAGRAQPATEPPDAQRVAHAAVATAAAAAAAAPSPAQRVVPGVPAFSQARAWNALPRDGPPGREPAARALDVWTVRAVPGRLSAISIFLYKSGLYGAFVWARRALNRRKRRFPARAVPALPDA
jgi:hypothetical protein